MNLRNKRLRSAPQDINRDLGFGSLLGGSQQRLMNPDGSFNVERTGLGFWESLNIYHSMLTMPLWQFMMWVTVSYGLMNLLFAVAYVAAGQGGLSGVSGDFSERFANSFFFSVHTFSTIGYGNIVPVGTAANVIVTVESLVGLLWLALATGLLFARFSRPTPRIMFSRNALIAPYTKPNEPDGTITGFMFRVANKQRNELINVQIRVMLAIFDESDGTHRRKFFLLDLERSSVMLFPSSWTVVHPIDANSPILGLGPEDLRAGEAEFLIQFTGIDETFFQTVHTWYSYRAEEIISGAKFKNIYTNQEFNKRGKIRIDISRLNEYDVVDLPTISPSQIGEVTEA